MNFTPFKPSMSFHLTGSVKRMEVGYFAAIGEHQESHPVRCTLQYSGLAIGGERKTHISQKRKATSETPSPHYPLKLIPQGGPKGA